MVMRNPEVVGFDKADILHPSGNGPPDDWWGHHG